MIGAFELPATFPVLLSGNKTIKVYPGIKSGGSVSLRIEYPFYKYYSIDSTLIPNKITTLSPTVSYWEDTKFAWIEDFEDPSISLDTSLGDVTINRTQDKSLVFEGTTSGKISLTKQKPKFIGISTDNFTLDRNTGKKFMEMNYNTETTLGVILMSYNSSGVIAETPIVFLFSTNKTGKSEWNKIYIDVTDALEQTFIGEYYKIKLTADITSSELNEATILLDNIKLLHF